ncbi:hypothetical protein [Methylomonas sp. TEB]|uniref:hypothetical protein n=1 Tax=Methylomonas sp. TEB TaxID=3398229 RepID=UPI0039F44E72
MEETVKFVLKLIHLAFTVFLQKPGYSENDAEKIANRIGWAIFGVFIALSFVTIKYGT